MKRKEMSIEQLESFLSLFKEMDAQEKQDVLDQFVKIKNERDTAINQLVALRLVLADSEKLNDKFSSQFDWEDRSKYSTIKKYSETNPFQSLKGISDFTTRVKDVVYSSMNKIKSELKQEAKNPDSMNKALDKLQKSLSSEMATELKTISLNHFVVQRETVESKNTAAKVSEAPEVVDQVKRNLNRALEEAAFDQDDDLSQIDLLTKKLESRMISPDRERELEDEISRLERKCDDLKDRLSTAERDAQRQARDQSANSRSGEDQSRLLSELETENRKLRRLVDELKEEVERLKRLLSQASKQQPDNFAHGELESLQSKYEELKNKLGREKEHAGSKEQELDKLRDANIMLKHRVADLEKALFDEKRNKLGDKDSLVVSRRFIDDQEDLRREALEKDETILMLRRDVQAHQEEKKRLLNHIDKLKRDMSRVLDARESHNNVLRIIETNNSQTQHDMILESYLKQGVYRTMTKSPIKRAAGPDEFSFLPQTRTVIKRASGAFSITTCAYIDRKDISFFEKKGPNAVQLGSYSKYSVYEKNPVTGEALLESKGCFNQVFSADKPDKLLAGLTRLTTGSQDKSFSVLVVGLKEKIYLAQLILRLFLDQVAAQKLADFYITGSDGFCRVLESLLGESLVNQGSSFRVDSEAYVVFAQAIELLNARILGEEFYFSIEYNRRLAGEQHFINVAAGRCFEELRKYTPIKKSDMDKSLFIRKLLQLNFRSESSGPQTELFVDRFLAHPIKMVFCYSHLVRDYLNDQFLTELGQLYYEERNNVQRHSVSPLRQSDRAPTSPNSGLLSNRKRDDREKTVDDKVKEAANHVKNIFKFMN